jgi:RecB family exonuclease
VENKPIAWSFSRLNNYETCPKKFYHLAVAKDVKDRDSEHISYGKMVHEALEKRVRDNQPLPLNLQHLEQYVAHFANANGTKMTEQKLCIDKEFNACDWFSKDAWCRAILDLAIINDKQAVVVDYKTGRISEDFTQLRVATALLMLHMPKLQQANICYLWTKEKQVTSEVFTRDEIGPLIVEMTPRLERYNKAHWEKEFPPRAGFLCKKYCPVVKCPYNGE